MVLGTSVNVCHPKGQKAERERETAYSAAGGYPKFVEEEIYQPAAAPPTSASKH
jgi:hypothetical protein